MCKKLDSLVYLVLVFGFLGSAAAQEQKGQILVEWWLGSSGSAVTDIRGYVDFPDNPDGSAMLDTFEVPRSKSAELSVLNDNYGARVIGYLYPPVNGDYTFWITSDNGSEFLLSTDDDPANATAICQVPGSDWTNDREWDKFPTDQKSNPVTLIGGEKYYVEAIYQEGGGGDGVAIGWGGPTVGAGPVIIDGQYLSPMIRPLDYMAADPVPADDGVVLDTWINMQWSAGYKAVSHDVYFGDNLDDLYAGAADTFQGNQPTAFLIVGFPGFPYPEGLVVGTRYYWRIDEKEADGTTHTGKVWSFLVPPMKAYNPWPSDSARFVDTEVDLSWEAGFGTKLHHVYFGQSAADVEAGAPGTYKGPAATTIYAPGALDFEQTYYWRIDQFDGLETYVGDVWSFTTTSPGLGTIVQEIWNNVAGTDINVLKDDPRYPHSPDEISELTNFDSGTGLGDDYGGRIHGWVYAPATGDYTFWLCSDDQGELWLSSDDDADNSRQIAYVGDPPPAAGGWAPAGDWDKYPTQQSESVSLIGGERYYISAIWNDGSGGDHCQVAWGGPGIQPYTIIPGTNLSPYEPVEAYGPKPGNRATDVTQTPVLSWKSGIHAVSHELYFGADEQAVADATKASPEYKGTKALGDESHDPGELSWETIYYWRVDEVNNVNPDSPWPGKVWSFTTADFLIIDDFEDYNTGDNQIWESWLDGLGFGAPNMANYFAGNGTGAAVGDETTASYTEETIVNSGLQSMPVSYDNNKQGYAMYSETEKTLATARNWTVEGITELSLWFRGNTGSVGSFVEDPVGTYTMTGSGADIWNNGPGEGEYYDEFHYAYKTLTGVGSIVAKVESVDNTNGWAKAGVMIRETLDPGSAHATMVVTPAQGVSFQRRYSAGATSTSANSTTGNEAAPYWVKIERDLAGNFTAYSSANGSAWTMQGAPENIQMSSNVYIGLAVTSHDAALACEAVFTNVTTTGSVGPQWANQDIGIASNDTEPLYVAISNPDGIGTGAPAVVVHDDPAASTIDIWTEWVIPLQTFEDQGIDLTDVDRIAIGLGTRGNMTVPGGSGKMFFDDIRLYRSREAAE